MKSKHPSADKSGASTQTVPFDGGLGRLIVRAIDADPAPEGARTGTILADVTRTAAGDVDVDDVTQAIDHLVENDRLRRENNRLYLEPDR